MALTLNKDKRGDVVVLKCIGFIDSDNSGILKTAIEDTIKAGEYKIVIDLEKTDYVSSAGWGLFVGYLHEVRKSKGDIKIASMKREVLEIFELLDFVNIFQYHQDVENAVKAF